MSKRFPLAVDSVNPVRLRRLFLLGLAAMLIVVTGSWLRPVSAGEAADRPEQDSIERDYTAELPRIPPTEPDKVLGTFEVHEGFRLELAAAEPEVVDPVAMSFDEDGRLYVVEMRGYSEHRDENLGRVRRLVDTDGDGRFDQATVFLDGLEWPTAVFCYDGGVFVAAAPDILYAKDHNGDGVADERRTVFTGFGHGNVQGLLNSFNWGLDNRIHGATSSSGGSVRRVDQPEAKPISLRGRDFAFNPRTLDLAATSGGAQHGLSFDDWGRKFVCSNSDHIQLVMFEDRYVARNPYLAAPGPRRSIASDGPQAEVFRISPVEPWRIVRTRLRVKGIVKGPVEGGGRAAGYFTGSTGVTIYRGNAWPKEFHGNAFIGDVGSNIVHRKILVPDGVGFVAHRADQKREFIASRDIWFRPAQFANAPDGTLYIIDVYREVIEHPDSLPPVIKKHLDLDSGGDRGRIYRVVPEGFKQPGPVHLSKLNSRQLVALLEHPNGWHRDTAARLLYERQDLTAVGPLRKLARQGNDPRARMHALYALDGLGALDEATLLVALGDAHPRVREHAVRLSERLAASSPPLRARLYAMVGDDDLRVRYQLAFSLGQLSEGRQRNEALAALARHDAGDSWMRLAVLSSLAQGSGDVFARLAGDAALVQSAAGRAMLKALASQVGVQGQQDAVAEVLAAIETLDDQQPKAAGELLSLLTQGLAKGGSPLAHQLTSGGKTAAMVNRLVDRACQTAGNESQPLEARVEAVRSLGLADFGRARQVVEPLLDHRQPQTLQLAAIATLDRFDDPAVASILIESWSDFSPQVRARASETLLSRSERIPAALGAIEDGRIAMADVGIARLRLLAAQKQPAIAERAKKLIEKAGLGRRHDVVEAYRHALTLEGDIQRGRKIFRKICAACHRLEGEGHEIAPNLATMQNRGPETIFVNVLDPNREVNPQFVNYAVITTEGRTLTGIIAAETATSITLLRAEDQHDTVLRIQIDEMQSTGLSLMPEGLEKEIDQQAMADLISYLMSVH